MSDEYIKKEDAINGIASMGAIHGSEGAWIHQADALGRLRAIPSADVVERQTWIPCSEKLPEERGWYDCSTIDNRTIRQYWLPSKQRWVNNAVKHIFDIYNVMSITGERVFYKEDGPYDFNSLIIAWMPPPPPYKVGEREGE